MTKQGEVIKTVNQTRKFQFLLIYIKICYNIYDLKQSKNIRYFKRKYKVQINTHKDGEESFDLLMEMFRNRKYKWLIFPYLAEIVLFG